MTGLGRKVTCMMTNGSQITSFEYKHHELAPNQIPLTKGKFYQCKAIY